MEDNKKLALTFSLFVLIGVPVIFFTVSLLTENWLFFLFSIAPALAAGLTGVIKTTQQIKEEKHIA